MKYQDKSKKQFTDELVKLRQRNAELEKSEIKYKQAEEALWESQERYKALFDRSLCCVYVHDFEGSFLDANKAALNLLGYTKKELLSLSLFSLIEEDQLPDVFKTLKEIKQSGSQKKLSKYKLRRKDGGYVWVETEASVIYKEGKPYAVQGVGRGITERKRSEEKEKQYAPFLAFLSRTAMEFVELPPKSDIYQFIGKLLRELVGNSFVIVNSFDETA